MVVTKKQIPNLLTFARLFAVPLALAIMVEWPLKAATPLFWIFLAASLTDYLDGRLARAWNAVTPLGTLIDPVADKLLVALMLLFIVKSDASFALMLPVAIIILRELFISGLREFLATRKKALPVSAGGKWKTAVQMVAILALLFGMGYDAGQVFVIGRGLLWLATLLTLYSAYDYSRKALPSL